MMIEPKNDLQIIKKIVLVVDICSSTEIIEDLLRTGNTLGWTLFLNCLYDGLFREQEDLSLRPYKFTGDGWILLIDPKYDLQLILEYIRELSIVFDHNFKEQISPCLEREPDITGLTFGLDSGDLISITMTTQEYIGRAINVACRLQSVIEDTDILSGYRIMMAKQLFQQAGDKLKDFHPELVKRRLKNVIRGGEYPCYRLATSEIPFKINKAIYFTDKNSIDVTQELISQLKENRIDTFVVNQLLGGDPDPGVPKTLQVEYISNGKVLTKTVREGARIQLP
jgi:hypothetical protein